MTSNKYYISKESAQTLPPTETALLLGKVFRSITQKLNSGIAFERILEFVFDSLGLIIPFDRIGIALVEDAGGTSQICIKWVRSHMPIRHLTGRYCAPLEGSSLQRILETGEPRIINDLVKYAAEHPESKSTGLALKDGIRSSLTCPLYANNKNIGIVFFSSAKINTYEHENVRTFLEISDELSAIIENGRLKKNFENNTSSTQNLRMILHDLKSPLSVIQGLLELTPSEDWYQHLSSEEKNVFSIMQKNSKYMFELLSELTELKQLDYAEETIKVETVTLENFRADLESSERLAAEKKNIKLRIMLMAGHYETAQFDPVKIHRVLDNLLTNAFKFSEPETQVTVTIKANKNRLVFEVSDQGQGIPHDEISKLFKEFGKTSVRPTGGESSSGLGLAIARKIVEQHGGDISVESRVGKGTVFSFWLPVIFH